MSQSPRAFVRAKWAAEEQKDSKIANSSRRGECGESAGGGQVGALEGNLGGPRGAVGGAEAGADIIAESTLNTMQYPIKTPRKNYCSAITVDPGGLVRAPAGEGLDGGGRAAGGKEGAGEADAEALVAAPGGPGRGS